MGEVTRLPELEGRALSRPSSINTGVDMSSFDCGQSALNDWLRQHALKNEGRSSRTYVTCDEGRVVGYYCLATGGASRGEMPKKLRHDFPNPVPLLVLGRLAVDSNYQKRNIGSSLLRDAMLRAVEANKVVGCAAILVHAKDQDALGFYVRYGFQEWPAGKKTLFLPISTILSSL